MTAMPPLPANYQLTEEHVIQFHDDGFIVLRNVFSEDELQACRDVIRQAAEAEFEKQGHALSFEGAFHQAQNLRLASDEVAEFCLSARLGQIAAQLLKSDAVRIYHDQALFKPGPAGPSFWHQDQYFWPLDTPTSLGLWLPLGPVEPKMGTMRYARGSHRLGDLGQHTINQESEEFFDGLIKQHGLEIVDSESFAPGDCAFHTGWTVHGARANETDALREAMVVTFYPDGTRLTEFKNGYQAYDAATFLGGRQPGELADSEFNPVVWPQG